MTTSADDFTLYRNTFFSFAAEATARVQAQGGRFVYYTSASTALKVLRNREIWMRNATTMNDFLEVEHGLQSLIEAYGSDAGRELQAALEECFTGLAAEIGRQFDGWVPAIRTDTFVTCVSEHDPSEDELGRLSMWRAYGGNSGVALVVHGGPMFRDSNALGAYSSPVAYVNASGVATELRVIAQRVRERREYVRSLGASGVRNAMFNALRYAAVCTKHPAFREEREWRVIASPLLEPSELLPQQVEDVGGTPQTVLKIRLQDHPERGLYGLEPAALIERVLIGPSEFPDIVARAFRQTLTAMQVPNANERVHVTGIPLRTWHG